MRDKTGRSPSAITTSTALILLVPVLITAGVLRWAALSEMSDMLNYDESFYAVDALSLLDSPRLTPFFESNTGRQSAWMYWLAAFFLGLGPTPFAARVAATFVSVLTVAATYRLGQALFGRAAGVGAAATMATLYWPVHLGHIAFRANLFPLLGALSLAFLVAAARHNRTALWIASGAALGLMSYTYISAYLWSALVGAGMILVGVSRLQHRKGAALSLVLAVLMSLPLVVYATQHPEAFLQRSSEASRLSIADLVSATQAWIGAWLTRGDIFHNHNLPGRPILDGSAALLMLFGLVRIASQRSYRGAGSVVVVLALLSVLPSLISETPPHFLRSIGLIVPIALVVGAGAEGITCAVQQCLRSVTARKAQFAVRFLSWAVPAALFTLTAVKTYGDFHNVWLRLPELEAQFDRQAHRAVEALYWYEHELLPGTPVYFVPREPGHPVVRFSQHRLSQLRVSAFDNQGCVVVPITPVGFYIGSTVALESLKQSLEPFGRVRFVRFGRANLVRFTSSEVLLHQETDTRVQFGERVEVYADPTEIPTTVNASAQIHWAMRFRSLQPTDRVYALFVHVYAVGSNGDVNDARTFAQGDQWLCASYPSPFWRREEVIVQTFSLSLPADLPTGNYVIAVGVYDQANGERLALPEGETYYVLRRLVVAP